MRFWLIALLILSAQVARAETLVVWNDFEPKHSDTYIRYGVGVSHSAEHGFGETKTLGIGTTEQIFDSSKFGFLIWGSEAGFWIDTAGNGRLSSGYGYVGAGMKVNAGPFVVSSMHGPGIITQTDAYLGSVPEFFHDVSFGFEDQSNHAAISIGYKHISNAGLFSSVNKGRDFLAIKLSVPF